MPRLTRKPRAKFSYGSLDLYVVPKASMNPNFPFCQQFGSQPMQPPLVPFPFCQQFGPQMQQMPMSFGPQLTQMPSAQGQPQYGHMMPGAALQNLGGEGQAGAPHPPLQTPRARPPTRGQGRNAAGAAIASDDEPLPNTEGGLALGLPAPPIFEDDNSRVSTSFKSIGQAWRWGEKRVTSFKFRSQLIVSCNSDEFPFFRLAAGTSEDLDLLIYKLCKLRPDTRISDLGITTKKQLRQSCRRAYERVLQRNRALTSDLHDNFGNLLILALRDGFPWELLSPQYQQRAAAQSAAEHFVPDPSTEVRTPLAGSLPRVPAEVQAMQPFVPAQVGTRRPEAASRRKHPRAIEDTPVTEQGPGVSSTSQVDSDLNVVREQSSGAHVDLCMPRLKMPSLKPAVLQSAAGKRRIEELELAEAASPKASRIRTIGAGSDAEGQDEDEATGVAAGEAK